MKTARMFIAAALSLCSLAASAQMRSGVDTLSLDKVNWRVTYTGKVINDTTKETPVYQQTEMRLDIGNKVTSFYNQSHKMWQKQVAKMILNGGAIDLQRAQRQTHQVQTEKISLQPNRKIKRINTLLK